jgi:hypothetical protein
VYRQADVLVVVEVVLPFTDDHVAPLRTVPNEVALDDVASALGGDLH